jgi:ketosteroid isomerase-like protein
MRGLRCTLVTVLMIAAASIVEAQSLAATKRRIADLEEQWIAAVIGRDSAGFDRLLAPTFVYTEDDRVYTKAQLIKEVMTSTDTVSAGRNEDLVIRVYGNAAVATGWLILSGRGARGPFEVRYRYTDTWVRTSPGGRWRVVAAQDYKKP